MYYKVHIYTALGIPIDRAANRVISFYSSFFLKHLMPHVLDIDMQAPAPNHNGNAL